MAEAWLRRGGERGFLSACFSFGSGVGAIDLRCEDGSCSCVSRAGFLKGRSKSVDSVCGLDLSQGMMSLGWDGGGKSIFTCTARTCVHVSPRPTLGAWIFHVQVVKMMAHSATSASSSSSSLLDPFSLSLSISLSRWLCKVRHDSTRMW